eukprot:sb/3463792/
MISEKCYRKHVHCRREVFKQLLHRLVTSQPLATSEPASLLERIARRSLQQMLSQVDKIKDILPNIPLIPLANARSVLTALVPVMRHDTPLRDSAMLVLKKFLFSKSPVSRRIAVFGLTEIMRKFKVGDTYSQASQLTCSSQVQIHMMYTTDINEAVCTEIALLLKRGLLQQGEVRSDIYDRMSVILTDNYTIRHLVIQQLEESLSKVYEDQTGVLPPLKIGDCIAVSPDSSVLREPLPNLLRAVVRCCAIVRPRDPHEVTKLDTMMTSTLKRAAKGDMGDWDLDKSTEIGPTGAPSRNLVTALTLYASLEVLLERVLEEEEGDTAAGEMFKKIFSGEREREIERERGRDQGTGKGKKSHRPSTTYFSLQAVDKLLHYIARNQFAEFNELTSCDGERGLVKVVVVLLDAALEGEEWVEALHYITTLDVLNSVLGSVTERKIVHSKVVTLLAHDTLSSTLGREVVSSLLSGSRITTTSVRKGNGGGYGTIPTPFYKCKGGLEHNKVYLCGWYRKILTSPLFQHFIAGFPR